ncbi:hypothetical protein SGFS_026560 [Streptomyces graminofaciens]|uniref:Uncharacterized protein n=1 Tax=Streptomyces graminofaciens TaxID=68212 RepID=A0ABM7F6A9_9ACTN|nr:hypothetical protein SGFS_026560 [Streptomyces graminofaciens]
MLAHGFTPSLFRRPEQAGLPVGPPLLPWIGSVYGSGRRQDWASVRIEAERKRLAAQETTIGITCASSYLILMRIIDHAP